MKSSVIKRSVVIGGHKTTISLEDQFWSALKEIAQAQGATLAQTLAQIDKTRQGPAASKNNLKREQFPKDNCNQPCASI